MRYFCQILMLLAVLNSKEVFAQLMPFFSEESGKYGYKDKGGKVIVEPVYDLAYSFEEGMATVRLNGKYGYLDNRGMVVVPLKYDFSWHFIGGYAAVKQGDKYGFVNKDGKEVVPLVYEDANNYHGKCCYKGMAHVKQNGKWKIIKLPQ